MSPQAVANTRFVLSPLHTTGDALWTLHRSARTTARGWTARVREAVREHRLCVLESMFSGTWRYIPDFLQPQPQAPEESLERELHQVATTDATRLTCEIALMLGGSPARRLPCGKAVRSVLDAVAHGESAFAERVARELHQLWHTAVEPDWPALRKRLDTDIERRARALARDGLAVTLTGLHPRITWNGNHIRITADADARLRNPTTLTLMPAPFSTDLHSVVDPLPTADQRQPILAYPAYPDPDDGRVPARPTDNLIGTTRTRLLSDLRTPRTTTELAQRHHLATATVSYHLHVLHRSGLLSRSRRSHHVLYQQTPRARQLLRNLPDDH